MAHVVHAVNPLLDEMRAHKPALVAAAMQDSPDAPRLFGDWDLPAVHRQRPGPVGAGVAAVATPSAVAQASTLKGAYDLIERYAGEPEQTREMATERANADYIQRFSLWLSGGTNGGVTPNIAPPQGHGTESSQIDAALHAEIFGEPSSS